MKRRRSRKWFLGALGVLIPPITAYQCVAAEAYTLRCNVATAQDSPYVLSALRLAAAVARRSGGQLQIEVYPNGQLATQQGSIGGLTTGVLDLTIQPTAVLVPLEPRFQLFDMPFLFRDLATCYRALDGRVGRNFFAALEPKGIIGLGWSTGGFREFETASKIVVVPEDMKGLRVRIVSGAVFVATYQALGAIPVTIDLSEIFTAFSQHTIDGMDITLDSVALGKYSTVVRHVAMLNHGLAQTVLMGSKRKIDALPVALQKILSEESRAVIPWLRTLSAHRQLESIQALKKEGVAFSEIQYAAFRKAVEPVYTLYKSKLGSELFDQISRVAADA
jgi:tripartite ATP-independent transporter DctP family solute receptor